MKYFIACLSFLLLMTHTHLSLADDHSHNNGLITLKSKNDVATTANKLEAVLSAKGMTIFARINHSEGAKKVGKNLSPTELVIFGNPKAGTPLMQCAQSVAIDLPQKMLIWQDSDGATWLTYNDPLYLKKRHDVKGCDPVLGKVAKALNAFAKAASQ